MTVASLTALPVLEGGRLQFRDAPLVRAARRGRVCVLDEADKAPTEVTVLLKALVEDGELMLADGRRLLGGAALAAARAAAPPGAQLPADVVPVHDDFRLWVLANRPGFPFHGVNLFRDCGDAFAAMQLDNADFASETNLLEQYAPRLAADARAPEAGGHARTPRRLAAAFAELRALAEGGALAYPYSMREAVAVARHLDAFGGARARLGEREGEGEDERGAAPVESVGDALANALAFEAFDAPLREQVADVFEAHGLPVKDAWARHFGALDAEADGGAGAAGLREIEPIDIRCGSAGRSRALSPLVGFARRARARARARSPVVLRYFGAGGERLAEGGASTPRTGLGAPKHGKHDPTGAPHVGGNTWAGGTGGSDTAGLGGRGGPYRLSDGNPVHQASERTLPRARPLSSSLSLSR